MITKIGCGCKGKGPKSNMLAAINRWGNGDNFPGRGINGVRGIYSSLDPPNGGGFGWNDMFQQAFGAGIRVFENQFTPRPTFSQQVGPQGSNTQIWGNTGNQNLLSIPGTSFSNNNLGMYLLIGGVVVAGMMFLGNKGHK